MELCLDALLAPSDHEFNGVREMILNREIDVNEPFGGVRKCRKQSQYSRECQDHSVPISRSNELKAASTDSVMP